jgi:hypothetical protein
VGHISGNKGTMGSIEVPIDRKYPDEQHFKFVWIAIGFYGRDWHSK